MSNENKDWESDNVLERRDWNRQLIERYPFLVVGGSEYEKLYDCTNLDFMPSAWVDTFGIQMCEDLRAALLDLDLLDDMDIYMIDEKYGQLRFQYTLLDSALLRLKESGSVSGLITDFYDKIDSVINPYVEYSRMIL